MNPQQVSFRHMYSNLLIAFKKLGKKLLKKGLGFSFIYLINLQLI